MKKYDDEEFFLRGNRNPKDILCRSNKAMNIKEGKEIDRVLKNLRDLCILPAIKERSNNCKNNNNQNIYEISKKQLNKSLKIPLNKMETKKKKNIRFQKMIEEDKKNALKICPNNLSNLYWHEVVKKNYFPSKSKHKMIVSELNKFNPKIRNIPNLKFVKVKQLLSVPA